ncbi:MAG TPA: hypothetical protein IAB66_11960 [Candidatus Caccousia avistercoris]|nr:hypothetical protein [Candidatus Caccousia avistercoris]
MKKLCLFCLFALCLFFAPAAHGKRGSEILRFPEETLTAEAAFLCAGNETSWELSREEAAAIQEWAAALILERQTFAPGHSPGDADGGEVFTFQVNEGEFSFSCVNGAYLLYNGEWYALLAPGGLPAGGRR